jgi:hypothetical protein
MTAFSLVSLDKLAALIPTAYQSLVANLQLDDEAPDNAMVLHITGDLELPHLNLDAVLASDSALLPLMPPELAIKGKPYLLLLQGQLLVRGAITSSDNKKSTHLVVLGNTVAGHMVVSGQRLWIQGQLTVDGLLWGHESYFPGMLKVDGGLRAQVVLFTEDYDVQIQGGEHVQYLLDEARGGAHLAEFSNEAIGALIASSYFDGVDAGEDGLADMLDRQAIVTALRAGRPVLCLGTALSESMLQADDLFDGEAFSANNILAVVRSAVVPANERTAIGWFAQTDFVLSQRHVDKDGDQRDDYVLICVWSRWDFFLSVDDPSTSSCTLIYRAYDDGEPGEWKTLKASSPDNAWQECQQAWRGVLDYVRKASAQARANYPLYQQLASTITPARLEALTCLPVFTQQYNNWWSSDRNGHWLDEVWVGARQPCIHDGESWSLALKLSWRNGEDGPQDEEDEAHGSYMIKVEQASDGTTALSWTYAQRQSDSQETLPPVATDHMARLLRYYALVEARLRGIHEEEQAAAENARRIAQTVQLLTSPPVAADLPDDAVFPADLLQLSQQWQTEGQNYVAAIRAYQLEQSQLQDGDDDDDDDVELPSDPRKQHAATVLQLARVVSQHEDGRLTERFRQRFAFAPDAYLEHTYRAGQYIGPVCLLDDGRIAARIGAPYDDGVHWVLLDGVRLQPMPELKGLGRSSDRRCFVRSDGQHITTHRGFDGPVLARMPLPKGNEGLPEALDLVASPLAQRCDELIVFNDGQRVLLSNPTGIYLITPQQVTRLHPQAQALNEENTPYSWAKNNTDDDAGEVLALAMLHMAVSPDERFIAVGDQDSNHVLLDAATGKVLRTLEPLSSYPHHVAFSHDSRWLFANSCHLYNGCTLVADLSDTAGHANEDDVRPAVYNNDWRVYASASTSAGLWIAGEANGYLRAADINGNVVWRHHISSTISAIDTSADGETLVAGSYGGYLAVLKRNSAGGLDPYTIGNSPYVETRRFIFWANEARALCW